MPFATRRNILCLTLTVAAAHAAAGETPASCAPTGTAADAEKAAARGNAQAMLAPSGGMKFFHAFAVGLAARRLLR